ncbi:MAG: ATP synthase F0 subunit B [Zetaproteobacteria bacterium]|nr:ATP synthase F0 subunit B [Zetaproteobacteria bacterium]
MMDQSLEGMQLVVYPYINFFIFLAVLIYFARKPLRAVMEQRKVEFQQRRQEAEVAEQKAQALTAELEEQLSGLTERIATLKQEAKVSAEAEASRIIEEGKSHAALLVAEAEREVRGMLLDCERTLKAEILQSVREEATRKLQDEMSASGHQELVQANIVSLKNSGALKKAAEA